MNKIILSSIAAVAVIAGASWYGYTSYYQVDANPDYICTATVVNPTCTATSYSPWVNGTRTAYGTKQVSVTYSNLRISCQQGAAAAGLNVVVTSQRGNGNGGGASGIHGSLSYTTEACSYTETDTGTGMTTTTTDMNNGGTGGTVESTIEPVDTATTGSGN